MESLIGCYQLVYFHSFVLPLTFLGLLHLSVISISCLCCVVSVCVCVLQFRWAREELDALQVYWNGKGQIFFKGGREIETVPSFFIEQFPSIPLEGMLW